MAEEKHSILSEEGAKSWGNWFDDLGVEPIIITSVYLFLLLVLAGVYDPGALYALLAALTVSSPLWLPVYLGKFFWVSWIEYIRFMFWFQQENVLLEIQLPQEVEKSPLAMETFLISLWNAGGETTAIHRIWRGSFRPIWSLEIASNEGRIGFYLRVRKGWRSIIEARLYGQFPEAKVFEVEDYVAKVPFNLKDYNLFGAEYDKGKPQALPLKTYRDYGLDKDPKEEYKIDPITNVLELLGQVGKNEYFWMQIILRAYKKDERYGFYKAQESWREDANAAVKRIMTAASKRSQEIMSGFDVPEGRIITMLTETERNKIEAIEGALSKLVFECGIRVLYLAKKENYVGVNAGGIIRFFDSFRSMGYTNSLAPSRGTTIFNFPWQDFRDIRQNTAKKDLFFRYKHRAYFYVPYHQQAAFLTTEELATLWHFPGSVVRTPGLNRVPSRRAEAPVNLPTS